MKNFKSDYKNEKIKNPDNELTKIIKRQRKEIMDISLNESKEEYIETFFDMMMMFKICNKADIFDRKLSSNLSIPFTLYHITHNDSDAIGCAILANIIECIGWNNNTYKTYFCNTTAASDVIRENVLLVDKDGKSFIETDGQYNEFKLLLITDISITDEVLELIENREDIIPLMIDHHPTNKHADVSWCYIRPNDKISATGLFFNLLHRRIRYLTSHNGSHVDGKINMRYFSDYFKPCSPSTDFFNPFTKGLSYIKLLKIINDISRYDTWEWQKSPSLSKDEDYTTIASKFLERDCYYLSNLMTENLLEGYEALETDVIMHMIERKKKNEPRVIERELEKVVFIFMGEEYGHIPFTLYDGEFNNSLMQAMYEKYTDAKFVASLFPSTRMLSIRSNKPDVHCGEIAKSYAHEGKGGGHAGAAGCTLSYEDTINILRDVFKAIDERETNG